MRKITMLLIGIMCICFCEAAITSEVWRYCQIPADGNESLFTFPVDVRVSNFANGDMRATRLKGLRKESLTEDESLSVNVRLNLLYDKNEFRPSTLVLINRQFYESDYTWDEIDYYDFKVPKAKYDVFVHFEKKDVVNPSRVKADYFVIIEDVEVNGDMEIDCAPSMCSEYIKFTSLNPDGEKSRVPYARFSDYGVYEMIDEGNVNDIYMFFSLWNDDLGDFFYNYSTNTSWKIAEGYDGPWDGDETTGLYITKVSDRYKLVHYRTMVSTRKDSVFVCNWVVPASKSAVYTNNPYDYVRMPEMEFVQTSYGKNYEVERGSKIFELSTHPALNGKRCDYHYTSLTSELPCFHNNVLLCQTPGHEKDFMTQIEYNYVDYREDQYPDNDDPYMPDSFRYMTRMIDGPRVYAKLGEPPFISDVNFDLFSYGKGGCLEEYSFMNVSKYSLGDYTMGTPIGYGVPLSKVGVGYSSGTLLPELNVYWVGRYGETRFADNFTVDFSLKLNNEIVASDLNEWWRLDASALDSGAYEIQMVNDNAEVENICGYNISQVVFDTNKEDKCPPVIQMLRLCDKNYRIVDAFEKGEDGELQIMGGDFNFMMSSNSEEGFWMEYAPAGLFVEYAPYGSDHYTALIMREDPDKFIMPARGAFWSGSLAQVDQSSESGWFDLRVTLTDKAGNYCTQTLSPCFKINALASVGELGTEDYTVRVSDRNIIAPEGSRVYTVSGLPSGMTDLTPGLYLVVTPSGTRKVTIR